ncbi:MAG: glycosyltransferase family 4 protein [Pseudomonadota bacterium]
MNKPTTVLHLLPDMKTGGGQTLLLAQLKASDAQLLRHVVCYIRNEDDLSDQYRAAGLDVIGLGVCRKRHLATAFLKLIWLTFSRQIDIVHANNTHTDMRFAVPLSIWTKRHLVVTLHGYNGSSRSPEKQRRFNKLWKRAARRLSAVIAVSEPVRESWQAHFRDLGLANDKIKTIRPIIELDRFTSPDRASTHRRIIDEFGLPENAKIAITVSRLVERKGLEELIKALAAISDEVPESHLLFVGDGPLRDRLCDLGQALGVESRLVFAGNRSDVPELLSGSDVFVFASESESFGLAPCEAMAAGLPIVINELPSLKQILVDGENAFVVAPGSDSTFALALRRVLLEPGLAIQMGTAGAAKAAKLFGAKNSAEQLASLYLQAKHEK